MKMEKEFFQCNYLQYQAAAVSGSADSFSFINFSIFAEEMSTHVMEEDMGWEQLTDVMYKKVHLLKMYWKEI